MADGLLYRVQFDGLDGVVNWVDIIDATFTGDATYIIAGSPPVELNYLGETDNPRSIIGSECVVRLLNETNFQFLPLFTGTCRSYLLRWKRDGGTVWTGFVDPDFMNEEFLCVPYYSTIHAVDGLGELKNFYYEIPESPEIFNKPVIDILQYILAKTGLELPIWIATEIKFRTQNGVGVEQRIFEYLKIDWRVFRLDDNTFMDLYSILEMITRDFRMIVFQMDGHWQIESTHQKYSTYNVDKYTWTGIYSMSFDKYAVVELTDLMHANMVRFNSATTLSILPAYKQFSIIQAYGHRESFLFAYNLDGLFWDDEWLDEWDLKFWWRNYMQHGDVKVYYFNIFHDDDNSFRIARFLDHEPSIFIPNVEFLQSNTVTISPRAAIQSLMDKWGVHGGLQMIFSLEYFVRADRWIEEDSPEMTLWIQICVQDTTGEILYATNGWPLFPDDLWPVHAYFERGSISVPPPPHDDPFIKLERVIPNKWNTIEINIAAPSQRQWNMVDDSHRYWIKIYPPQNTTEVQYWKDTDGLMIRKCKLGWTDYLTDSTRTLDEPVNELNKLIPSPYEFNFGETPARWGTADVPAYGHEYMNRFNLYDENDLAVHDFSTLDTTGTMGGLINSVHRMMIRAWRSTPRFILTGEIWDLSGAMNFGTVLKDFYGNMYVPGRLTFYPDTGAWNGEWVQIHVPTTTGMDGGSFNWDFSGAFDI